ncbi:MAG: Trm112 family protein [Chakrabartia sp.]
MINPILLDRLVCPITRTALVYDAERQELISNAAGLAFPVREGVAIMLVEEARPIAADAN